MHYYKTTIQYEGTNYAGFQWQNGLKTIQSEFNSAVSKLLDGKFTTMAASRTDPGVHAIEQVVKISAENPIDLLSFVKTFNHFLPRNISCLDINECAGLFRPASAESKEYRYFFTNKTRVSKAEQQFIGNISNPLNIEEMMTCVRALVGTHDFCNFYSMGSNVKSSIRCISVCELSEINPHAIFSNFELFKIPSELDSCYQLQIQANGFLKQMIRHIVSALWMVGTGKLSGDDFLALLNGPKIDKQLWKVASPNGLFLYQIFYS